jgi:hypothetical protein
MLQPGLSPSLSRSLTLLPGLLLALLSAPAHAHNPKPEKYPLRIHVLAAGVTHRTPRMSPGSSVACDTVDDILSAVTPNPGGPVTLTGVSGDPCSIHADIVTGRYLDSPDQEPAFSGEGRGDLVSPPTTTQAITFNYDDCSRIRVRPGFQSLPARWKKPGQKLEVLIPSDEIPNRTAARPLPPVKCSFRVTLLDFVYLRLPTGKLIAISQDIYRTKPALRNFLSGGTQTIQQRTPPLSIATNSTH